MKLYFEYNTASKKKAGCYNYFADIRISQIQHDFQHIPAEPSMHRTGQQVLQIFGGMCKTRCKNKLAGESIILNILWVNLVLVNIYYKYR